MPHASAIGPFDSRDPLLRSEPHPIYHRYRAADPVHLGKCAVPGFDEQWWIFRHEDASFALSDPRFGSDWREFRRLVGRPVDPASSSPIQRLIDRWMLSRDGSAHARLRSPVSRAFTPRVVSRVSDRIAEIANEILDDLGGSFDAVEEYARPLSIRVIAELLGVPESERGPFGAWFEAFIPAMTGSQDPAEVAGAAKAASQFQEMFRELLAVRRASPEADLISGLAADPAADEEDAIATCVLILGAGIVTTQQLIANGTLALLRDRGALTLVRDRPGILERGIDELLRFEGPTETLLRYATEPVNISGRRIEKDELVGVVVISANRDPEVFSDPDRLDLERNTRHHLGFGRGIHSCLGASLARVEGATAITTLVERFPRLRLGSEPLEWKQLLGRSVRRLPLEVG
jgi:cytochrome P450